MQAALQHTLSADRAGVVLQLQHVSDSDCDLAAGVAV